MSDIDDTIKELATLQRAHRELDYLGCCVRPGLTDDDRSRIAGLSEKLTRRSLDLLEVLEEQLEQREQEL